MFDQSVSPVADPFDISSDICQCVRMGRVETVIIGNPPLIRDVLILIKKQTYPDSRADTFFFQLVCKAFHIRELGVTFCPWSSVVFVQAVMLLPAVINNHEWRIFYPFSQFQDVIGIT